MIKNDIKKIIDIIKSKKKIIILLHNNPDPDSIASALGMRYIINSINSSNVVIAYGGIIGRAENQEMRRALKVNLVNVNDIELKNSKNIIMVDAQPGTGNNQLPNSVIPKIVIDHHPLRKLTVRADFYDVRTDYGSTSTIILEYLRKLSVKIDKRLATALFYGIKTDTDDIARDRNESDNAAMNYLYPMIEPVMLSRIQHPRIPMEYYARFAEAIKNACLFKDIIISDLKNKCDPDMIAEMSDFFLRMKGIRWVLCLGIYDDGFYFSIRTTARSMQAAKIAMRISKGIGAAGGHHKSAGGYVKIAGKTQEEVDEITNVIKAKFLKSIRRSPIQCKRIIKEENGNAKV